MLCSVCEESLLDLSKRVYTCKECSLDASQGDMIYWCNKCKESTEHEHKRSKLKAMPGAPKEIEGQTNEKDKLDALL
jgi:predicted amidophosphoribosyltransferase